MASAKEIFKGDTVDIDVQFKKADGSGNLDISTATTTQIIFTAPARGDRVVKTASFVSDGTDGKLRYSLTTTDLPRSGPWRLQGYVVLASGQEYHTKEDFLVVKKPL